MDAADNPFALLQSTGSGKPAVINGQGSEVTALQGSGVSPGEVEPQVGEGQSLAAEARKVAAVDRMVQTVFLITVDQDGETNDRAMPPRCVFLVETAESLQGQNGGTWNWLGWDVIDRAVFERLLLEDPAFHVLSMNSSGLPCSEEEQLAGEKETMRYLFACHRRSLQQSRGKKGDLHEYAECCRRVVVSNAVTCLLTPELFSGQDLHAQTLSLLLSCFVDGGMEQVLTFLLDIVEAIQLDEDLSLAGAFRPLLDRLHAAMNEGPSLSDARNASFCAVLDFYSRRPALVQILMEHVTPSNAEQAKSYETTVLGIPLSHSCLPKHQQPSEFFTNPSRATQRDHNATQEFLWQPIAFLNERMYQIFKGIFKSSADNRNLLLAWLGNCMHANAGRGKLWSRELPNFGRMYASDSFFVNLGAVLLRFCGPITALESSRILGVDLSYCRAQLSEPAGPDEMNAKGLHLRDLPKETFLIQVDDGDEGRGVDSATATPSTAAPPLATAASPATATPSDIDGPSTTPLATPSTTPSATPSATPAGPPYKFTTEIFFMTQRCLHLGYHSVLERFNRLNRELHRIQESYQEMQRIGAASGRQNPAADRLRDQMDLAMSLFLSFRTALLEPSLVQHSWNLHLATARLLVQLATTEDRTELRDPALPRPVRPADVPQPPSRCLALVPEFLAENLTLFLQFLRRFAEQRFEDGSGGGERSLGHLLTFIVTFMGSKERMSNPHLRAKLAEVLEGLMPPKEQANSVITAFHREKIFQDHPLLPLVSRALMSIYVDIEFSGDAHAFEQKFNYRRPMYHILKYLWSLEKHRNSMKETATEALGQMDAANAPLFLRFINLLINDSIFMLDEAMDNLKQIKELQHQRDSGEWRDLPPSELQQRESSLRTNGAIARFFNVMSNESMNILSFITSEIKAIFIHPVMVDRVAAMFNDFLLKLVGPKMGALKVKNFDEFDFKPGSLVQHICRVYLNLGGDDVFCAAVSRDGRSYSPTLFTRADRVLRKIMAPADVVHDMVAFADRVRAMAAKQEEEEEIFADAPDEFIDPLTFALMSDPVTLPSSRMVMDRAVIARHLLSDHSDPFNRSPLTMEEVVTNDELRQRIEDWKRANSKRH